MSDMVLLEGIRVSPASTRNFTNVACRLPIIQICLDTRDFRLPPQCKWDLHSFVLLRSSDL